MVKKNKFMVVSGFLGAGKTTSMIVLTEYINEHGGKAAIIANDLGSKNIVDAKYTDTTGLSVTEIAGGCICYQTETLVDKLRKLRDMEKVQLVMSDIPGCGVGALDHVYHKLNEQYPDEFELAPLLVITDPERLRMIMPEKAQLNLPKDMVYLLNAQLAEADIVVLNKIDLLSDTEINMYLDLLNSVCMDVPVFAVSAKEKIGIREVADYLISNRSKLKVIDVGYGGTEFIEAEKKMSWYNRQFFVKTSDGKTFNGNAFISMFIEIVRRKVAENNRNIPHLKIFALGGENDFVKASLLGIDYDIEFDKKVIREYDNLRVIVNVRAVCESMLMSEIMNEALDEVAEQFDVYYQIFFTECFGMMDEGRI